MIENNDFIQLPPIKKDTPSEVVSMIWQYLKLGQWYSHLGVCAEI